MHKKYVHIGSFLLLFSSLNVTFAAEDKKNAHTNNWSTFVLGSACSALLSGAACFWLGQLLSDSYTERECKKTLNDLSSSVDRADLFISEFENLSVIQVVQKLCERNENICVYDFIERLNKKLCEIKKLDYASQGFDKSNPKQKRLIERYSAMRPRITRALSGLNTIKRFVCMHNQDIDSGLAQKKHDKACNRFSKKYEYEFALFVQFESKKITRKDFINSVVQHHPRSLFDYLEQLLHDRNALSNHVVAQDGTVSRFSDALIDGILTSDEYIRQKNHSVQEHKKTYADFKKANAENKSLKVRCLDLEHTLNKVENLLAQKEKDSAEYGALKKSHDELKNKVKSLQEELKKQKDKGPKKPESKK